MKECPNCKSTYTDDSLQFCLNDGARLTEASNAETVRMVFDTQRTHDNVSPPDSVPTVLSAAPPIVKKGVSPVIVGVLAALLLLVIGGFAAYVLLRPSANKPSVADVSPSPTVAPTTAPTEDTAKLKEEMANLRQQIEEQKNQNGKVATQKPSVNNQTGRTARANSPRDGFLALRSEPSSDDGYRIAQIPHGALLTVYNCSVPTNIGKMSGHWCQVVYNNQAGWAFDAFMIF